MTTLPPIHALPGYQLSPRRKLLPGRLFKTIRGSGPKSNGSSVGTFGVFLCRRLYTTEDRVYAEALSERTRRVHDLYISGPPYISLAGTCERPYSIKLVKHDPERIRRLLQQAMGNLQRRKPR